jgi:hypothetical protein
MSPLINRRFFFVQLTHQVIINLDATLHNCWGCHIVRGAKSLQG